MKEIKTYAEAGVDIEKGDRFADFISKLNSPAIAGGSIGGFAGGLELDLTEYKKPVMLSATDGVGTKLMVAQELKKFDTLGIDLVAMCVNDLVVCGAAPQVFLDYIGCGSLNEDIMKQVITGVVAGCEQAECMLSGGETAEMPDMYEGSDFDLAGFSVGLVDKDKMLPRKESIKAGDIMMGIPSTGIHSNGLSLARKIIQPGHPHYKDLLTPTKIYVREMKQLLKTDRVKAAAHITGGGFTGNVKRALPEELLPEPDWNWPVPEIFEVLQQTGSIDIQEMRKVFNMGIGMVIICSPEDVPELNAVAEKGNFSLLTIGTIANG